MAVARACRRTLLAHNASPHQKVMAKANNRVRMRPIGLPRLGCSAFAGHTVALQSPRVIENHRSRNTS